jgi:hypothetical protein
MEDIKMMRARNSQLLETILLPIAFCLVSIPAQAQYTGSTGASYIDKMIIRSLFLNIVTLEAPVDVTSPGDIIKGVPDNGNWPVNESPDLAIDDNTGTKYLHFNGDFDPDLGPTGFRVTPSNSQNIVTGLTFTTANDYPGRDPVGFELYGSNISIDGPYNLIASGDIIDFGQRQAWPRFTKNVRPISFANNIAYDHYQLLFTEIRGPAGGMVNSMQIAEVELLGVSPKAYNPKPANDDFCPASWVNLTWSPGYTAVSHDVYFGESYTDVDTGAAGTFRGNQTGTVFTVGAAGYLYPGGLVTGRTYYWRIDEVQADGITVHKGDVWNFTVTLGGWGLQGEYYQWSGAFPPSREAAFSNLVMTRIDPQINFNWGYGPPDPSVDADNFAVRWTGEVEAAFTEFYTFYTTTDDGVRLWVDDDLIIDEWGEQSPTEWSGTINLVAGRKYSITMEMYEHLVGAVAELRWSSRSTPKQLIPQAALSTFSQPIPVEPIPVEPIPVQPTPVQPTPIPLKYGGGAGELNNPYLIYTAEQMNAIGVNPEDWDKHFKLMADIDLGAFTGTDFNLIGYYISDDDREPFTGVFDGNNHTISNFSYTTEFTWTEGIGLFQYVGGTDMEIKNLGLIDPNVVAVAGRSVGSLVGIMEYGAITNCYVQDGHISGNTRVGGLLGRIYVCVITDCYANTDVGGFEKIGGLVGENYAGVIKNCSSASDVFGTSKIGGLVGVNEFFMELGFYIPGNITGCCAEGTSEGLNCVGGLVGDNLARVTDSYATADVFVVEGVFVLGGPTGNRIGGLVGHNYFWSEALIRPSVSNCYSTGNITESIFGSDNVGGLVGLNEGTVTNSFWDIETSGQSNSDGGTGRTTTQMQRKSTFINAGWDFVDETANGTEDIWRILEGQDYPRLTWELIEEEPKEVDDSLSAALDTDLSFTTSGDVDWFSQTRRWYHDGDAVQSGSITHDQESWLQTSVNGSGTLSFFWKVSSEGNYDCLEFYIDGILQDQISGTEDWHDMTYEITVSGFHTLEWRYFKDGSMSRGDDCGWVDKVEWMPTP